jgi:hypothetical protein
MIARPARHPFRHSAAALLLALMPLAPLAAQDAPTGFSLPQPTPTPTPAPAGPADERAGVAIPPRTAPQAEPTPAPRIAPAPVLTSEPDAGDQPRPAASPARRAAARTPPPAASAVPAPPPAATAAPVDPLTLPATLPQPQLAPAQEAPAAASAAPALPAIGDLAGGWPAWWPWAAGGAGALVLLLGGFALWRRRKPKVLRLATPAEAEAEDGLLPDLPLIDVGLEITAATRSLMMFTLGYQLTFANRAGQAVTDISAAVQLVSARRGDGNAASPGAAQELFGIDRIGPSQSRIVAGEVRLPLTEIAVLRQGRAALFIPLLHVTLEGRGQTTLTRSFVIGTPSTRGTGRLHPILLDTAPGSVTGLTAKPISVPEILAAA